MAKESSSWRPCYLHSTRPAIGECERCGKPICSACVAGSGDERCCPPCSRKPAGREKQAVEDLPPIPPSPTPRAPDSFRVGEVTIHADGTVEAPETRPSGVSGPTPIVETPPHGRPAPPPKEAPVERSTEKPKAKPDSKKRPVKSEKKAAAPGNRVKERIGEIAASNRTFRQLYYALPFALLAGVIIYAFWIFLALLRRQWVQTSVLTAGITVPWALYKGTTFRKQYGKPIYGNSPKAIYMALASFAVMAILFICAEYLAFVVVYRGSDLLNPFHLFLKANTDIMDIAQIVLGFLLSVSLPYWLKLGEGKRPKSSGGD